MVEQPRQRRNGGSFHGDPKATAAAHQEVKATSSVELLPRAKLQTSTLYLLYSMFQIALSFVMAKFLSFLFRQPTLPRKDLHGTITIVTGANAGIGYEIAKEQYLRGSHVILACRNEQRAKSAKDRIIKEISSSTSTTTTTTTTTAAATTTSSNRETTCDDRLEIAIVDCSSLENVREFAKSWKESERTIDYLFLNAGIAGKPTGTPPLTKEGFDLVYVTNHLGPFLLTGLLSPFLSRSARVILTSSAAAAWGSFSKNVKEISSSQGKEDPLEKGFHYPGFPFLGTSETIYGQSKAMQIIFANLLQAKFDQGGGNGKRITASFHPGFVDTNIFTTISAIDSVASIAPTVLKFIALTGKQGAQAGLWLALSNSGFQPGGFYERNKLITFPWYNRVFSDKIPDMLWKRWNSDAGLQDGDWQFK